MTTIATKLSAPTEFTDGLGEVLGIMAGSQSDGCLALDVRTWDGFGHEQLQVEVRNKRVPNELMKLLMQRSDWAVAVSPSQRRRNSNGAPLRLEVLFARFRFDTDLDPEGPRFVASTAQRQQAIDTLKAFNLFPSAIIDAEVEAIALWRLAEPLDLSSESAHAAALKIQAQLALATGASTAPADEHAALQVADHDPLGFFQICGIVRSLGNRQRRLANIDHCDPAAVFSLDDILKECGK